jgi:hypothetical protein
MSFLAPSAHQDGRIHLRGVPDPLWSAFVVGSTLAVCSPPDPAGLFHPAALLGFQTGLPRGHLPKGVAPGSPVDTLATNPTSR